MIDFNPKRLVQKFIDSEQVSFTTEILIKPNALYQRQWRARWVRLGLTQAGKIRVRPHEPLPKDPDARRVERLYRQRACMRNHRLSLKTKVEA
jgi:hypothetical protein